MNRNILTELIDSGFSFSLLTTICPELLTLQNVPQNPEYHGEGDVFCHTQMVCCQLCKLDAWQQLPLDTQAILFLAAAFHDIGKSACTRQEDGKWISPRHTILGEKMFRGITYREAHRFGLTFPQRELAAKLIRYHGLPVWFWTKQHPELELYKAAESIPLKLLYLLSKADILGRIENVPGQLLEQAELFGETARELNIWETPHTFANPYTRFQFYQKGNLWCDTPLYDNTSFDVILMSGLPLSGKDTWIAQNAGNFAQDIPVISLDDLREKLGIAPSKDAGRVVQAALELARGYLRKEQPFIWNATNLIGETRQKLVGLFSGYGARVHILYLEVPYTELIARNRIRARHIPENVLETMIRKLEIPCSWEAYEVTMFL